MDKKRLKLLRLRYTSTWTQIFQFGNFEDIDKPLTPKILSDPNNKVTRHLLYLYSMESFIYQDLNRASREKDETKIKYYGAFAAALSYIIYFANKNRKIQNNKSITRLYRGVRLNKSELSSYAPGMKINLIGYTSTTEEF